MRKNTKDELKVFLPLSSFAQESVMILPHCEVYHLIKDQFTLLIKSIFKLLTDDFIKIAFAHKVNVADDIDYSY